MLLIDATGRQDEETCLKQAPNTFLSVSCPLTWHNQFYFFGGYVNQRQIAQIKENEIILVGKLDFKHHWGGCSVMGENKVFICFNNYVDYNVCHMAMSPLGPFSKIQNSTHHHNYARIAASDCKLNIS